MGMLRSYLGFFIQGKFVPLEAEEVVIPDKCRVIITVLDEEVTQEQIDRAIKAQEQLRKEKKD